MDVNQSGFKKGHSTETALLSVTEALWIVKPASKLKLLLILLDLSAAYDTVNSTSLELPSSGLGPISQGRMERRGIQSTSTDHRGSPGLSAWTPPLHHLHHITGTHHTGTWFLLPLLC